MTLVRITLFSKFMSCLFSLKTHLRTRAGLFRQHTFKARDTVLPFSMCAILSLSNCHEKKTFWESQILGSSLSETCASSPQNATSVAVIKMYVFVKMSK